MKRFFYYGLIALAGVVCSGAGRLSAVAQTPENPKQITFADDGFAPMFPFVQCKGAPDNITNVQTWGKGAKEIRPAGADGFMRIEDGRFVNDAGPFYVVGTNLCASGNFPKEKADAERLAESLSRYGINCVRLHHMDNYFIWGAEKAKNHLTIDPEYLDRLDYMIYQFQQHGIYVNINLHVSRYYTEREGFENADQLPKQGKGVDNFEPRMVQMQKDYARDLLTHVNPYTKKAYIEDPGVAMVEINNENSIVASWSWGAMDSLPSPYIDTFARLWNEWLVKKYQTTENLKAAWDCRSYEIGPEMVPDGQFPSDVNQVFKRPGFDLQLGGPARVNHSIYKGESGMVNGRNVLKLEIVHAGDYDWIPQLHRTGLAVVGGTPYTLKFKARASKKDVLSFGVREDHDPWGGVGLNKRIDLSTEWQQFEFAFIALRSDNKVRISFSSLDVGTTYELADVSLVSGGEIGLAKGEFLEKKNLAAPKRNGLELPSPQAYADVSLFLHDLEDGYWQDMYKYVKGLGTKQPITGTQLQYGFWSAQAKLDYTDIHAYWNHPSFPRKPWDPKDWYVNSKALVNTPASGKTVNRLAAVRILGAPLTVSEYDHPYPNLYCAEGLPAIFAMASFQNWAGVFQFAWKHDNSYEPDCCRSFFDMSGNQVKMAHLPACGAMITRNYVRKGPEKFVYCPAMSEQQEIQLMSDSLVGYHRSLDALGIDYSLASAVNTGINLTDRNWSKSVLGKPGLKVIQSWADLPEELGSPEKKWIRSESGELYCNWEVDGKGYFICSAENVKVFSGFVADRTFNLGDGFVFTPGKTRLDWTTFSMVRADDSRFLLTATGLMANEGMKLLDMGEGKVTCTNQWGKGPALCEGIPAQLTIPADFGPCKVFALDQDGNRKQEVKLDKQNGQTVLTIDPKYQTIWYELDKE